MLKWFGIDSGGEIKKEESAGEHKDEVPVGCKNEKSGEATNEKSTPLETRPNPEEIAPATTAGLGSVSGALGLLSNFATAATKTAQKLKESVDVKLDQTIIGDFQRENEKFVKERHTKRAEDPVPPWVGYNEEKEMKAQILALSSDERNFLRDPPSGVDFHFDHDVMMPVALTILAEDKKLQNMRFNLVPKKVKEETFWRNYFYRVSLIKQSSQLSTLAQSETKRSINGQDSKRNSKTDPDKHGGETLQENSQGSNQSRDTNDQSASEYNRSKSSNGNSSDEKKNVDSTSADWEKELQDELQDFEFVSEDQGEAQEPNPEWEKEIEDMLGLDEEENEHAVS